MYKPEGATPGDTPGGSRGSVLLDTRYRSHVSSPSPLPSPPYAAPPDISQPGSWIPVVASVAAAAVAALIAIISIAVQRKSARETLEQTRLSVESSKLGATAADRSSKAAEEAVKANERIADRIRAQAVADAFSKRYQDAAEQVGA